MGEVWFVRHGESVSNAGEIIKDIFTIPLSERGIKQAEEFAKTVGCKPDLIVTTPYSRTGQTAAPLVAKFPDVKREVWDIYEFSFITPKLCENSNKEIREPLLKEYWDKRDAEFVHGEGAESFSTMVNRIKSAFKKLEGRDEEFIVIFTHGIIMRTIYLLYAYPEYSNQQLLETFIDTKGCFEFNNCEVIKAPFGKDGVKIDGVALKEMFDSRELKTELF